MPTRAAYLASLEEALRGPGRVRRSLVREAADHLEDATDAYVRAGLDESAAESRAIADFGTVDEVASSFQTTLAVASARRTSLLLLTVLAVQPFVWDDGAAAPDGWFYALLDNGIEVLGMLVLGFALLTALVCGIGNRWFRAGRAVARLTGWVTLGSGAALVATGVTMTLIADGLGAGHWTLLTAFLVAPVLATSASAHRTLAAC